MASDTSIVSQSMEKQNSSAGSTQGMAEKGPDIEMLHSHTYSDTDAIEMDKIDMDISAESDVDVPELEDGDDDGNPTEQSDEVAPDKSTPGSCADTPAATNGGTPHHSPESDTPTATSTSGGTLHQVHGGDPPRGLWPHRLDFFFSCLGYSVGLGALWRFPYLVYKHGGGAFLFPYTLFLLTLGIPLLYLEMALGQYASQGPTKVWQLAPLFGGLGYAMVALSFLVATYYNVFISWLLYFFFASMTSHLPWASCNNTWNSQNCCESRVFITNCSAISPLPPEDTTCFLCLRNISDNSSIRDSDYLSWELPTDTNETHTIHTSTGTAVSPTLEYFHSEVLGLSSGIEEIGVVQWRLLLCLVLAWSIIFSCVCLGIRSSAKVVYVTSLAPFVILIAIFIKCGVLDGARNGMIFFLKPNWERLKDGMVWRDAAGHVIFTLGPCYGGILTLSSYNEFTANFYRVTMLVPFLSTLSSLLAGLVVFTCLGNLAWRMNSPIENVITSKFDLAFITYPEALSQEHPVVVAFFFLLLVFLAIDSILPLVHTIMASILDQFPQLLTKKRYVTFVALGTCGVLLVCGIPLTTKGGVYLIELLDSHTIAWPAYIIGAIECLVVTWLYGFAKQQNNIWIMIGKRPGKWWQAMWGIITPFLLVALLLYSIIVYQPLSYQDYSLPQTANIASWVLSSVTLVILTGYAVYAFITTPGSFKKRLRKLTKPPKGWGPSGRFADFLSNQFWTLPDYMVSEKEEVIQHPLVWKRKHSLATTSDGELESISTMDGILPSPLGAQHGENIDTGSVQWSEDENKFRGNWTGRWDFLFSGLGYSIGIGNVWRFPYVVYKNGGGSFFLPYLLMLILCGIPLFYMELVMGQFASVGPITIWRVSPLFKGVGYAAVVTLFFVCIYYNVFAAWSIYYIAASMTSDLPWAHCNNTWNTENCRERSFYNQSLCGQNSSLYDGSNYTSADNYTGTEWWQVERSTTTDYELETAMDAGNVTNVTCNQKYPSPSAEYFFNQVLKISKGIGEPGEVQWPLALCLLFCWTITFIGLIKGVKSAGKVVYATVLFPFLILLMLLIRFVTLDTDAHLDGIKYYVTPQWETLGTASVWGDAASQLFFSLGLCMGGLTALGSYNRFHYDCFRDAYLICCLDTLTSAFAGFVIFAILGVMAREQNTTIDNVIESSFALAFIAYPDAVTRLPVSTAWAILFFLMMFLLAVDSQFLMMEAIVIAIMDEFSKYLWKQRIWVILGLCVTMFLLGLPFVTQGGVYLLVLVDSNIASWSPLVIGILTSLSLAWIYKIDNFCANIKSMLGTEPRWWWRLMWKFVTPAVLLFILLFSWIMYKPATMDSYEYPLWAQVLGVLMSLFPILCIPVVMLVQLLVPKEPIKETFIELQQPTKDWGPALEKHKVSCFLPNMVNPDETMARIAQWVATGHSTVEPETDKNVEGNLQLTESIPNISSITQEDYQCLQSIADDSSIVGYTADIQKKWAHAAKMVLKSIKSPGSAVLKKPQGEFLDVRKSPLEKKRGNSGKQRVRFPSDTEQGSVTSVRSGSSSKVKVKMVNKSTQTGKSKTESSQRGKTHKNMLKVKADMHSYDNPSFESRESRDEMHTTAKTPPTSQETHRFYNMNEDECDSGISSAYMQKGVLKLTRNQTDLEETSDEASSLPVDHGSDVDTQDCVSDNRMNHDTTEQDSVTINRSNQAANQQLGEPQGSEDHSSKDRDQTGNNCDRQISKGSIQSDDSCDRHSSKDTVQASDSYGHQISKDIVQMDDSGGGQIEHSSISKSDSVNSTSPEDTCKYSHKVG